MQILADSILAEVGTGGAQNWVKSNIIPMLLFLLGAIVLWKGKGGDNAGATKMFGPILMGLTVLGVAITGGWEPIARFIVGLFT